MNDFYIDRAFIFRPLYMSLNKIVGWTNTPCIRVKPDSSKAIRVIAPIANVAKKAVAYLAIAIAALVGVIFSLISFPFRSWGIHKAFAESNKIDLNRLSPSERSVIQAEISQYVEEHGTALTTEQKKDFIHKIMVSYARSHKVYGPIARTWTEYLLEKANRENKKLVFMARDGIHAYKIACKLMATPEYQKKYPNLVENKKIVLGYISKKSIESSRSSDEKQKLFQEYVEQELGIQKGDKCFFVDIGFAGSMVDKIKALIPDVEIDFEYCMATTDKATGFVSHQDHQLNSLSSAWANPAVYWLEDAHQGNGKSCSEFVKIANRIYPNTMQPQKKQMCTKKYSFEYMIRKFCQKAVVRCAQNTPLAPSELKKAVATLDEVLEKIQNCTMPWFIHHQ